MESKPLSVRILIAFVSIVLFLSSAFGLALMIDTYVAQQDYPTAGSVYQHLGENIAFYRSSIFGVE